MLGEPGGWEMLGPPMDFEPPAFRFFWRAGTEPSRPSPGFAMEGLLARIAFTCLYLI